MGFVEGECLGFEGLTDTPRADLLSRAWGAWLGECLIQHPVRGLLYVLTYCSYRIPPLVATVICSHPRNPPVRNAGACFQQMPTSVGIVGSSGARSPPRCAVDLPVWEQPDVEGRADVPSQGCGPSASKWSCRSRAALGPL